MIEGLVRECGLWGGMSCKGQRGGRSRSAKHPFFCGPMHEPKAKAKGGTRVLARGQGEEGDPHHKVTGFEKRGWHGGTYAAQALRWNQEGSEVGPK